MTDLPAIDIDFDDVESEPGQGPASDSS
jgi:hypothetical protein